MNSQGYRVILFRQIKEKWGRFLLASGGIMIGIWAISLTTSLSLGLSTTIVTAINSQSFAREITLTRTQTGQSSFFEITQAPVFVPIAPSTFPEIMAKYPEIVAISPEATLNVFLRNTSSSSTKCVEQDITLKKTAAIALAAQPASATVSSSSSSSPEQKTFDGTCKSLTISSSSFQNFYEAQRSKWVGSTAQTKQNEIVTCFQCGDLNLNETLGVSKPEDMVGKKIVIEYQRAPELFEAGKPFNIANLGRTDSTITTSTPIELTISAVIDDRGDSVFGTPPTYLDYIHFKKAFTVKNPSKNVENYGTLQNTVFIQKYEQLDSVVKSLQSEKYLAFSLALTLISAIQVAFTVLTWVLAGFGFIALVASIFGIINVMTISVLERKREIGVLKALGARDGDIFNIFFLESCMLGVFGWLLGTGLSLGMGSLISLGFQKLVLTNPEWSDSLKTLNISDFSPSFPWWLLLTTFVLAVTFTSLSGVFPAVRAAKQDPVDVLRGD